MSDVKGNVDYEATLARVYRDLLFTIAFLSVGWVIFMYSIMYYSTSFLYQFLGMAIAAGPFLPLAFLGGMGGVFASVFRPSYEVVTTDAGGNVLRSDGGAQSAMNNLFLGFIFAAIMIVIGVILNIIKLIVVTIKYIYYYAKTKIKPAFHRSGFLLIVIGFAVLIGTPIVIGIKIASEKAWGNRIVAEAQKKQFTIGNTLLTETWEAKNLYEKTDFNSTKIETIPPGSSVTIVGEPVRQSGGGSLFLPVEYQGIRGFISASDVQLIIGTATLKESAKLSVRTTIRKGETVNLLSFHHGGVPGGTFGAEYNGEIGNIRAKYLSINK